MPFHTLPLLGLLESTEGPGAAVGVLVAIRLPCLTLPFFFFLLPLSGLIHSHTPLGKTDCGHTYGRFFSELEWGRFWKDSGEAVLGGGVWMGSSGRAPVKVVASTKPSLL